ncbi:hypothetical protein ACIO93_35315 [Streptomyces sp. NPDC087903]|uniref:hypothetical protein n=1 Tax=Streptomyces sp. NPDC087903 TaxID=3365819 RepID=UPI0038039222
MRSGGEGGDQFVALLCGGGLPDITRALVCCGPHSEVRVYDPKAGRHRVYGPAERIEVVVEVEVEVGRQLDWAEAGCALWPGNGLPVPAHPGGAK